MHSTEIETLFDETLGVALKQYKRPATLGKESALATPYFLGRYLRQVDAPETARGRGRALQRLLDDAMRKLWPGEPPQSRAGLEREVQRGMEKRGIHSRRYFFQLLDVRYFHHFYPSLRVDGMLRTLALSRTRFYEHLKNAQRALAAAVLETAQPNLRLEVPVPPRELVGRDGVLRSSRAALARGDSASISGGGGVGKTALAAAIVAAEAEKPSFWHTFRPGLNDDPGSVIYALAHFLRQLDADRLWLQLMARQGEIGATEVALGFLRADLAHAADRCPIFCFDEVDVLHTATRQPRHGVHKQVLWLLAELSQSAAVLFVGQRPVIDVPFHVALQPLSEGETGRLLARLGLEGPRARDVYRRSGGNPRLAEIIGALLRDGGSADVGKEPALQPLFNRLWRRLDPEEKEALTLLAIFRTPVPDTFFAAGQGLAQLRERNLIHRASNEQVTLLPALREIVYESLTTADRTRGHLIAARIRTQVGRITEAAYHLWRAGEPAQAVQLWYRYRESEIRQGKAGAAHAFFTEDVPPLPEVAGKQLHLIRNTLNELYGKPAAILADMDSYVWHADDRLGALALEQWGNARLITGDFEGALSDFNRAIDVYADLTSRSVALQRRKGQLLLDHGDMAAAERAVDGALADVARLKGHLAMARGEHHAAQGHFTEMLAHAESSGDEKGTAKANHLLMMAYGNAGALAQAEHYAGKAEAYYRRVGDRLQLASVGAELAGCHLNVGDYATVLARGEPALAFFEEIGHDVWITYLSSNLAEAYFETGDLDRAEAAARRALEAEEHVRRIAPYALFTLARVWQARGKKAAAATAFDRGVRQAREFEDHFIGAYLLREWGRAEYDNGNGVAARKRVDEALALFQALGNSAEVEKTARLLASFTN